MNPASILVISVARIGDTILLTPCLKAIKARYPKAKLTVLAHPKRLSVLEHLPTIDHLGGITKTVAPWRGRLPGKPHDAALVFGRDAALVRYALRVAKKVVCFDEPDFSAIDSPRLEKVAPPVGHTHAVHHRLLLTRRLGIDADDFRLSYQVAPAERIAAQQRLQAAGVDSKRHLIGLQLFSFPAKAHRDWPVPNFIALVERISAAYPGAHFLVLGDQLAARQAGPLVARHPDRVTVVAGELALRESVALMSLLDLYVGVDTGPTHLAGALGIPMVAMYHWQYPGHNLMPLDNPKCQVIEHPRTGDVDPAAPSGMDAVSVEQVAAAALALLDKSGRGKA